MARVLYYSAEKCHLKSDASIMSLSFSVLILSLRVMPKAAKSKSNGKVAPNPTTTAKSEEVAGPTGYPRWWMATAVFIAAGLSYLHNSHLHTMFENDRHFSHLADFEREMAFRTEMGLYFSYYKTIINADSFSSGLSQIVHDDVTEYGHTINTLKRFNLYPEVFVAALYRNFKYLENVFGWRTQTCYQINRGNGVAPVESCEGIGNSHYFYINYAFLVSCTVVGILFLLGVLLSDSLLGGVVAAGSFFFNHGEATRAQWTPPLRETFGFPLILAQILVVSYILKNHKTGIKWSLLMAVFGVKAMLSWQFSQLAFFTQVGSLFVIYAFDYITFNTMLTVAAGHLFAFFASFVFLFGNEMLLAAMYFPSILAILLILFLEPGLNRITLRPLYVLLNGVIFLTATIGFKIAIAKGFRIEDDAHIIDILRSKFTNFANFHTRLYTCSAEFDFLKYEVVQKLTATLLIPAALVGLLLFICYFLRTELSHILWRGQIKGRDHADIFYNVVQCFCYTVMACLIMRLKLFMTPHLCVVAALIASAPLVNKIGIKVDSRILAGLVLTIVAIMANEGKSNLVKQWAIRGEYSNPEQENLFNWIIHSTPKNAVFGGTMPVMANVKLSTERPIVNHPHYEDVGIRERTIKVYSMFSRKPVKEVHNTLKQMGVQYFVFQLFNCAPEPNRPYCAYRGMWDEQDPANSRRPSLCDLYHQSIFQRKPELIEPFKVVYNPRNNYIVLKV